MVKFCKGTYNLITCALFTDFVFLVYIAVMFSCCLFCSSLFLYVLLCTCLLYFLLCAASYGVIKNDRRNQLPASLVIMLPRKIVGGEHHVSSIRPSVNTYPP